VGSLTDRHCWCWGWNLYLRFSIFVLVRVCMSFQICTFLSIGVRRTTGARLNSSYTQVIPSRVIHVCLRVFAFHRCIRLCTVCFKLSSLLSLLLPSILFVSRYSGENPLRSECDQGQRYRVYVGSRYVTVTPPKAPLRGSLRVP